MPHPAATHEDFSHVEGITGSSDRSFGLVFAGAFGVIALWPIVRHRPMRVWALALAAAFLVVALVRPELLGPLNRLWLRFSMVLQRVVTFVVMALLFFGTVTPVAILMRLLGKDPLRLRFESGAGTYWIDRRPPGPAPDTMRNQF